MGLSRNCGSVDARLPPDSFFSQRLVFAAQALDLTLILLGRNRLLDASQAPSDGH